MKIGIISGSSLRHTALASFLNKEFEIIQFSEIVRKKNNLQNKRIQEYFKRVNLTERKIFNDSDWSNKNYKKISLPKGEINKVPKEVELLLDCDVVLIFGSSIIKDPLYSLLSQNKLINLHMGISPEYTGAACNFWALYDNNIQFVGGTIQTLSKKLDLGKTIKYCFPELDIQNFDPVDFSMRAVRETFLNLPMIIDKIDEYIGNAIEVDKSRLIRNSKIADFDEKTLEEFYKKKINLNNIEKRNFYPS
jgi:methionyl-tRNA formyltransferase